jgi:hypothetical protein
LTSRSILCSALLLPTLHLTACAYVSNAEHTERVEAAAVAELQFGRIDLANKRWSQCSPVAGLSAVVPIKNGVSGTVQRMSYRWHADAAYKEANVVAREADGAEELVVELQSPDLAVLSCGDECTFELTLLADLGELGERELWSHPKLDLAPAADGVAMVGSVAVGTGGEVLDWNRLYTLAQENTQNHLGVLASNIASLRVAVANPYQGQGQEGEELEVFVAACPSTLETYDSAQCVPVSATVVEEEQRVMGYGNSEFAVDPMAFGEEACLEERRESLWQWYLVVDNDLCQGAIDSRISDHAFRLVKDDCDGDGMLPDCNDDDPSIYEGAAEVVDDGIDQDCNEYDRVSCFEDDDSDGFGDDLAPGYSDWGDCVSVGMSVIGGDCDDTDPDICPSCRESPSDGVDSDCNGSDSKMCSADDDGDDFGSYWAEVYSIDDDCSSPGEADNAFDCDDSNDEVAPDISEIADDGIDQDCNGHDKVTCYDDLDGDGFGSSSDQIFKFDGTCVHANVASNNSDCDDSDADRNPAHPEICDEKDNDCDGSTSEVGMISADGVVYSSITEAVNAASGGASLVELCDGTFEENVVVAQGVTIRGVLGAEQTIIEGQTAGEPTLLVTGANVSLEGLTITGGAGLGNDNIIQGGGGIAAGSTTGLHVTESTIRNNTGELCAGGFFGEDSELVAVDVYENTAEGPGGGLCFLGAADLEDSSIYSNSAGSLGGGFIAWGGITLVDSAVYLNSAEQAGGAMLLDLAVLTSVNTDWGTQSKSTDNEPDDILILTDSSGEGGETVSFKFGNGANFVCTGVECI